MKNILSIALIAFLISPVNLHAREVEKDIIITLDGMTCIACVNSMNKVFSKSDVVQDTYTDLETQTITIDIIEGSETLKDDKIKEHIEWGGYDLISIERFPLTD